MKPYPIRKILLIQTAFIGDVILATALAESLHARFPEAQISILLRKGNESLFEQHPFIQQVLVWDKKAGKYLGLWRMLQCIRQERFDLVLNLHRFASSGFLAAFSGAKSIRGYRKNPLSFLFHQRFEHQLDGRHEVQRNHQLVADYCGPDAAKPKLYPSSSDFETVKQSKSYLVMAPASIWFTKQWPEQQWISLIQKLPETALIIMIGGKADHALCERIRVQTGRANVENHAGRWNLLQSAALMAGAQMSYTNDSAPMHLCSAMNAPVTAIFCSTVPAFGFGPLSDKAIIAEVAGALDCRPCGLHGHKACPKGHFKCSEIVVD